MDLSAYTFKQYPDKEQAELRVRMHQVSIKVPGSWFDNLTPTELERGQAQGGGVRLGRRPQVQDVEARGPALQRGDREGLP